MVLRNTLLISVVISLTGCANNTFWYNPPAHTMSREDMKYYKYDCAHAAESKAFLEYQLKNISPYDQNNPNRGTIQAMLVQMRDDCGNTPQQKPVGCTHVREELPSGSAVATVCNSDPKGLSPLQRPTINHWDSLVDTK